MIAISNSVSHVGKWCLSLQTPQESKADPFPDPESRQFFTQVTEFLIDKAT